jgi:O-antigen/teichoic acid export membrane protein
MLTGVLAFAGVGSSLIYAAGRAQFIFLSGVIGAALVVSGCFLVSDGYGAFGVACVRLSVQTVMIGAGTYFIHRKLGIIPPYATMGRIACASALAGFVAWLIGETPIPLSMFAGIVMAIPVYLFSLRLLHPFMLEDTQAILQTSVAWPPVLRRLLAWLIG